MFVFENGVAIDRDNNVRVKQVDQFYDSDFMPYYYYNLFWNGIEINFEASEYLEPINYTDKSGRKYEKRTVFAMYVIEGSLLSKILGAREEAGLPPITNSEYLDLRRLLADGMLCLVTRGREQVLRHIRIEFVDTLKQVPPSKPLNPVKEENAHG